MTLSEFLRLAREMRALQKEFFAASQGERREIIGRARRAEKRFDEAIEEMSRGQRGLFDGESP